MLHQTPAVIGLYTLLQPPPALPLCCCEQQRRGIVREEAINTIQTNLKKQHSLASVQTADEVRSKEVWGRWVGPLAVIICMHCRYTATVRMSFY